MGNEILAERRRVRRADANREAAHPARELHAHTAHGGWRERNLCAERAGEPARFRSAGELGRARDDRLAVPRTRRDGGGYACEAGADAAGRARLAADADAAAS